MDVTPKPLLSSRSPVMATRGAVGPSADSQGGLLGSLVGMAQSNSPHHTTCKTDRHPPRELHRIDCSSSPGSPRVARHRNFHAHQRGASALDTSFLPPPTPDPANLQTVFAACGHFRLRHTHLPSCAYPASRLSIHAPGPVPPPRLRRRNRWTLASPPQASASTFQTRGRVRTALARGHRT